MDSTTELEKSYARMIDDIIEYLPNTIVSKTIIRKITGNITTLAFDAGEKLAEKTSPFDNYVQIIDGKAELTINGKGFSLTKGECIIIPAHALHIFNAYEQFKMISMVIKSGYED